MNQSVQCVLENIFQKLSINVINKSNLCESLNHRELFYFHLEICRYAKKYMPHEYIRSLDLIKNWLNKNIDFEQK